MPQAFILNKPPGCISARRDFAGRPTLYDHVPPHYPALPHVGRLDWASEGLMLFTDHGVLAARLLDPHKDTPTQKRYHVKIRDVMPPDAPHWARLERPLHFRSGPVTRPAEVRFLEHRTRATWIEVILRDGKNRQIRRLCEREGLQVLKLRRVAFGPLELGDLPLRWCRPLTDAEWRALHDEAMPGQPVEPLMPFDASREAYLRAKTERQPQVGTEPVDAVELPSPLPPGSLD